MRLIDRRVRILSLGRKVREAKQRAFNAERRKTKYPPPPTPEKIANVLDSMMDPAVQIQNAIPGSVSKVWKHVDATLEALDAERVLKFASAKDQTDTISDMRSWILNMSLQRPSFAEDLSDSLSSAKKNAFELAELGMDDLYAIHWARTELREGINLGDARRLLGVADPELVIYCDGRHSEFCEGGMEALQVRLEDFFKRFTTELVPIVFEIRLKGDVACSHGLHDLTLTPNDGSAPIYRKNRYMDVWRKSKEGEWKLWMYIDNPDVPDPFRTEST